jgi:hypothetical protein
MGGGDLSTAVTWPRRAGLFGLFIVISHQHVNLLIYILTMTDIYGK